jgi:hypothetical protein
MKRKTAKRAGALIALQRELARAKRAVEVAEDEGAKLPGMHYGTMYKYLDRMMECCLAGEELYTENLDQHELYYAADYAADCTD